MSITDSLAHENSLEARIGLYWLHRLGIISLVLGFAFLMMYSFQYIGPVLQLLTGLIASLALIVTGELMAKKAPSKWFGHGLTAGGWSLGYFTAYAAHFLPSVAVISSMPIETALLIAVAGGSLASALAVNSELMAIFSVTLAAASILLSGPGLFGDISFLVIAVSAAILVNRKSWTALFGWSVIACYAGHFYCSIMANPASSTTHTLLPFFLTALWLTFALGSGFSVHLGDRAKNVVAFMVCLNAYALAAGLFTCDSATINRNALILAGAGTIYLGMTRWLLVKRQEQFATIHSLLGLALINCAKSLHYSGLSLLSLDVIQIAVLALIGLRYNIRSFRWVAVVLTCTFIPLWFNGLLADDASQFPNRFALSGFFHFEHIKIAFLAVSVLSGLAYFARHYAGICQSDEHTCLTHERFNAVAANLMNVFIVMNMVSPAWQALAWGLQAAANHVVFVKCRDSLYLNIGALFFVVSLVCAWQNLAAWTVVPIGLMIAAFYAMYKFVSMHDEGDEGQESYLRIKRTYALAATVLVTTLLYQKMSASYLSLSLGVEGLLLLTAGFIARDGLFRLCGLVVMALLTGKLLFVDMANYNTLGRIVSFIGAGFAFLISSYAYARFTRAFEDSPAAEESESEKDESEDKCEDEEPQGCATASVVQKYPPVTQEPDFFCT